MLMVFISIPLLGFLISKRLRVSWKQVKSRGGTVGLLESGRKAWVPLFGLLVSP